MALHKNNVSQVLEPKAFVRDVCSRIDFAKKTVLAQSMHLEAGPLICEFADSLMRASKRGVDVSLNIDGFALMIHKEIPIHLPILSRKKRSYVCDLKKQNQKLISDLRKSGVNVTFTNVPGNLSKYFFFWKRNHIKMVVVDKEVAYIGGVNFSDINLGLVDFMVRIHESKVIDALSEQFDKINGNNPTQDLRLECGADYTMFIDSGKSGKSLIRDEVCKLVKTAKRNVRVITTQYYPGTEFESALRYAANKKISIEFITTHPRLMPTRLAHLTSLGRMVTGNFPVKYNKYSRIHAKLLIIDDGEKVMFGSHNFNNDILVTVGTQELSILSRNRVLNEKLLDYYRSVENSIHNNL